MSAIGLLDAGYLTFKHYLGDAALYHPRVRGRAHQRKARSRVFRRTRGALYYIMILALSLAYIIGKEMVIRHAAYLTPTSCSPPLILYLQLFVIKAICLYCMASAATSTILFMLGAYVIIRTRRPSTASSV